MGNSPAAQPAETLVHLVLRARHTNLIQTHDDWRALGLIAARMLFWCGGAIYACRSEGTELRFALQVAHAPLGTIAHQIVGAYGTRLRQLRGIRGAIFKHYNAIPLPDDTFLDDLVFWLHRAAEPSTPAGAQISANMQVWTAESAYLIPNSLPWIDTDRVLSSLSVGAPGPATYRRRRSELISPQVLEFFTRRPKRAPHSKPSSEAAPIMRPERPDITMIARLVAEYCKVSYEDMLTDTRKRSVSRARVIATVLATRNGATAAAAARLFNRSRSTLIEQVEHHRATQPKIFAEAESRLQAFLAATRE